MSISRLWDFMRVCNQARGKMFLEEKVFGK